ncbi:putative methyltransferase NSUN5 [Trichinella sp. T6]|nr:putative methyltransferase NSUN5 [Trichinella sp. T6]
MDEVYRECGVILKRMAEKRESVRNLVFKSKCRRKNILMKLCCQVYPKRQLLNSQLKVLRNMCYHNFFFEEPVISIVLLYEYFFGYGNRCSYLYRTNILKNVRYIEKLRPTIEANKKAVQHFTQIPRYARVNTLIRDTADVVHYMESLGMTLIPPGNTEKHLKAISVLEKWQFTLDLDVADLLIFAPGMDLHDDNLLQTGQLILEDKSSCLPVICLDLEPGTTVLDICAAPGNKTSHMASLMNNKGKIISVDHHKDRVMTLRMRLESFKVTCCEVIEQDFLKFSDYDPIFENVTHVLLDPPCSGSGVVNRVDFSDDEAMDENRLKRLSNLQAMMLKKALSQSSVMRCVYSTCSIYEEENEAVVEEILKTFGDQFALEEALPGWTHRGLDTYEFGSLCVRCSPEEDMTNGFFVAVFQRKDPNGAFEIPSQMDVDRTTD